MEHVRPRFSVARGSELRSKVSPAGPLRMHSSSSVVALSHFAVPRVPPFGSKGLQFVFRPPAVCTEIDTLRDQAAANDKRLRWIRSRLHMLAYPESGALLHLGSLGPLHSGLQYSPGSSRRL